GVLGPRWIARAAHAGEVSLTMWLVAAGLFFLPTAPGVVGLSPRFSNEGGVFILAKEALGDFHRVGWGWGCWVFTSLFFSGLVMASAAMSVYLGGERGAALANEKWYLIAGSLVLLGVATGLNLVGLNIGKWLQNAGGVGTYIPLMMLVVIAAIVYLSRGQ